MGAALGCPARARAAPADPISPPGLELAGSSVFGFPFNIPRLRSPRLHANIQPLLPLLFSKKEKHCEKRLQRFLGTFQSREAALGAAVPAHSAGSAPARAVIPQLPSPPHSATAGYGAAIKSFKLKKREFGVVNYTALHSNPSAKASFVGELQSGLGACAGLTPWPRGLWGCCPQLCTSFGALVRSFFFLCLQKNPLLTARIALPCAPTQRAGQPWVPNPCPAAPGAVTASVQHQPGATIPKKWDIQGDRGVCRGGRGG